MKSPETEPSFSEQEKALLAEGIPEKLVKEPSFREILIKISKMCDIMVEIQNIARNLEHKLKDLKAPFKDVEKFGHGLFGKTTIRSDIAKFRETIPSINDDIFTLFGELDEQKFQFSITLKEVNRLYGNLKRMNYSIPGLGRLISFYQWPAEFEQTRIDQLVDTFGKWENNLHSSIQECTYSVVSSLLHPFNTLKTIITFPLRVFVGENGKDVKKTTLTDNLKLAA